MDADRESFLAERFRYNANSQAFSTSTPLASSVATKLRKNLLFFITMSLILFCLTIYLYLNMEAINENSDIDDGAQERFKPLSRRKPMLDHESIFSDSGPSMIKLSDLLAHCIVALRIAGQEVVNLSLARNDKISQVGSKGQTLEGVDDVVTSADMKSHHIILNTIRDSYRRLKVVSEEDGTRDFSHSAEDDILPIERVKFAELLRKELQEIEEENANRGSLLTQHETLVWIDPLDATKEYSENLTNYVTLMACIVHKSRPIAGVILKPFTNETYWSMLDASTAEAYHSPDLRTIIRTQQHQKEFHREQESMMRIIVSRSHAGHVRSMLKSFYGDEVAIISAGGSGYKTIELIGGRVDAYMHLTHIKKWDICAPQAILNSIKGGRMSDLHAREISFGKANDKLLDSGLIATIEPSTHDKLLNLTAKYNLHQN